MKHILLTGATGFLGSHLLEALLRQGTRVSILKRSTSDTWRIKHLLGDVDAFDIDMQPLEDAFKPQKFAAVIHTACNYGRKGESAHSVVETNLLFGLRLLDAATFFNTDTFLNTDTFFNTDTLSYKYLNTYSLSKKQFSEWLKQRSNAIQIVNLKLEHMYGPKDDKAKFIPWLIYQLQQGVESIPLTEGKQLRDFIFVEDVVSAYLLALNKVGQLKSFTEFDVGTGKLSEVRSFVSEIYKAVKSQQPELKTVLDFGAILPHEGEMMGVEVDNTALKNLGWQPTYSHEHGIKKTIEQYSI